MDARHLAQLAAATPNRGDVHVFLGHPLADLCDTTTVEPGNGYSPGVWTYGISVWVEVDGELITPDRLPPEEISWGFGGAHAGPPCLHAEYGTGGARIGHELCHLGTVGAEGVDFNRLTLTGGRDATLYIVVRAQGPAGGPLKSLDWCEEDQRLLINGTGQLIVEFPRMSGEIVTATGAEGLERIAVLSTVTQAGAHPPSEVRFKTVHGFADRPFGAALPRRSRHGELEVDQGIQAAREEWESALPARVFAPDPRVGRVWEMSAYHILAAMEAGLPRIGAINYPSFWMRDGVIILRALDLIGRHDLARMGATYLAPLDFAGGFGAEADAPGEGIWALVSHARLQPDAAWLQEVFPHIGRRVDWIERMLGATEPLRALSESRMPRYLATPGVNVLCLPAEHGLIHGRMDWHSPDFYINCWAVAGLRLGSWAAARVGEAGLAERWSERAAGLEAAIAQQLLPGYGNERDPAVAPYPTQALSGPAYRERLRESFAPWYRQHRLDAQGARIREPLWTYFEAAQIHNALRLGMKEEAWVNLNGMLRDGCEPWGIAAWIEGSADGNESLPYANGASARGWLQVGRATGGNMPHGWTCGEMVALLRSVFVEEREGELVLGPGVPAAWLAAGSHFGARDLPTEYGVVSYELTVDAGGRRELRYSGPTPYRCGWE